MHIPTHATHLCERIKASPHAVIASDAHTQCIIYSTCTCVELMESACERYNVMSSSYGSYDPIDISQRGLCLPCEMRSSCFKKRGKKRVYLTGKSWPESREAGEESEGRKYNKNKRLVVSKGGNKLFQTPSLHFNADF